MTETENQTASRASSSQRWLLKYGDRIYGPYSQEAMNGYIAEGRVIASSIVAPDGTAADDAGWQPANAFDALAEQFGEPKPTAITDPASQRIVPATPSPQKTEPDQLVQSASADQRAGTRPTYGPAKGQTDRRRQPETANFIVVMDIKARYAGPLEQAIMSLGPAYKLAPNVWCVNTDSTAAGLLNDLSIHIGKTDSMFIVDATRDRTAWHNLGPETDAKIRRVWRRAF